MPALTLYKKGYNADPSTLHDSVLVGKEDPYLFISYNDALFGGFAG